IANGFQLVRRRLLPDILSDLLAARAGWAILRFSWTRIGTARGIPRRDRPGLHRLWSGLSCAESSAQEPDYSRRHCSGLGNFKPGAAVAGAARQRNLLSQATVPCAYSCRRLSGAVYGGE